MFNQLESHVAMLKLVLSSKQIRLRNKLAFVLSSSRVVQPSSFAIFLTMLLAGIASVGNSYGQLVHRYSFNGDASDSVGSADGQVIDAGTITNAVFSGGVLDLSANTGEASNAITEDAYVNLPNGIVSAAASNGMNGAVAFEWWYSVAAEHTWQRVGDFGNSNNGEDTSNSGSQTDYLSIVATSGRGNAVDITNHTTTGFEPVVGLGGAATFNTPVHVMAVFNHNNFLSFTPQGGNGTMSLYVDGALIGNGPIHPDIDIRTFEDVNNWLGRSQWADPLFDGSYDEFRIYDTAPSDDYVANSFAAGPNSLAGFEAWVSEFNLSMVVDRDTGTFTLVNEGPAINVIGINISSATGALNPDQWLSVQDNYDSDSGGANPFDPDNAWTVTDNSPILLAELDLFGGDGGQLGTGGTADSIQLGDTGAWSLSTYEDLIVSVDRLNDDFSIETIGVRVEYINGIGQTAERSDLDFDGDIDANDWIAFASHHFSTFEGMTVAQAAVLGDLDADLDNDYFDFLEFESDFDAANGTGALATLIAASNVPEPTSILLLLLGSCTSLSARRRSSSRVQSIRFASTRALALFLASSLGLVLCGQRAEAQIVGTATGTFDASAMNGTFDYALQGGGNALVVGTYIDNNHTASNMQYGGVAADGFIQDQRMSLFYFFNPAANGTFTVDFSNTSPNGAFFIAELLDVDLLAPVDLGTGPAITTTVDDQFVINFVANNNDPSDGLSPAAGSIATLLGVSNANGAIGGGSIGAAFADGRAVGAAGAKTLGWAGFGGGFEQGQVSAAFAAPPILIDLTLVVNKDTGELKIRNETAGPVSFDYYAIQSASNALSLSGWNSLDDQNVDFGLSTDFDESGTVDGPDLGEWEAAYGASDGADADGDGDSDGADFLAWQSDLGSSPSAADGWIEAGASSTARIGELFLNGATVLGPGEEVSLGAGYNTSVFGSADGDLVFDASTGESPQLLEGTVVYVTGAAIAAVPEPGSLTMLLGALAVFASSRRRTG